MISEKLVQETHTSCPPVPYHRTEQFRAETARMLFIEYSGGAHEPAGLVAAGCVLWTDALIAALDKPQPPTP